VVSGWTAVFWIVMGGLGLLAAPRLDLARSYALTAALLFVVVAVWGRQEDRARKLEIGRPTSAAS
jgi:hypothetical protein